MKMTRQFLLVSAVSLLAGVGIAARAAEPASQPGADADTNSATVDLSGIVTGSAGPRKITGIVHAPDGRPAPGVLVRIVGEWGSERGDIKTDADGKFDLKWSERPYGGGQTTPCVLARDVEHGLAVAVEIDDDTRNLDLKLAPGLTIAGKVEAGGNPLTNATAALLFWTGRSGFWLRGLALTNTPGQYEIPALPPGRRYGVVVSAPGYGQKQMTDIAASAEATRQELDPVELRPANLKLAGRVLDADDKPVANCHVNLYGDDQPNENATSDRDGRFVFAHVCEGTVRLSANDRNSFGSISAEGGDTNIVLRLGETSSAMAGAETHKLKGVVTDPDGQPVAGAQLAVFPRNGGTWFRTATNGSYNITWSLQPWQSQSGVALLIVRDARRNLAAAQEVSDEATNLDLKLQPALTLVGQVKDAADAPLASAQVGVWLRAGNTHDQLDQQYTSVNADGRYEIKCLPPEAQYTVFAMAEGYGRSQLPLEIESESNRVEVPSFVLKLADRVIAGQVLNQNDKPVSGADVSLSGEGQPQGSVSTDSQGRFHFKVCEGQISLFANSGSGYAQASAEAGDTNISITLGSNSGIPAPPRRASLKGNPLPDLTSVNLAIDVAPAGQPILLCLFDAGQRPSRHAVRLLDEKADAFRQKNVCVIAVQAAILTEDNFNTWKSAVPVSFPVGRLTEKSSRSKWVSDTAALPWLILTDANHRVIAEGFSFEDLDDQIVKLAK